MTDSVERFQTRARMWLAANADQPQYHSTGVEGAQAFQAALHEAGFAGISWPRQYGGQGLSKAHEQAFVAEAAPYSLPPAVFEVTFGMCAPILLTLGTEEQKRRYIGPMLRGEEIWCQMFSEPGAGSDVASLQSRAVADQDGGWTLNGQKAWTSVAQVCSYGIVLARTDPDVPKHAGLSMFVLDMHAPGVTIRPLKQMNGRAAFNEVFFDDVAIPAENLVGTLNDGWHAATTMLMFERVAIGGGEAGGGGGSMLSARSLAELATESVAADPLLRHRLADLYVQERALELLGARIRQQVKAGKSPGPIGSSAKLASAELAATAANLAIDIIGPDALAWGPEGSGRWSSALLSSPAAWIAGGTGDIQRNIIGERVLGLPREPTADKSVPFRELKVGTQTTAR